jgi:ABC-type glycerol-3-phosphate transport system permease component
LFPVLWAVSGSFRTPAGLFGGFPVPQTLANYRVATQQFPLVSLLLHSAVIALGVTAGDVVVALLAAYALVRLRFRGSGVLMATVVVALLVPAQTLIIPEFVVVSRLHWLDTYQGLIVPQWGGCALAVLLLRQGLRALPEDLFAAAALDGAGSWRTLWQVVLPLLWPSLGAVAILTFITTWNEYVWPLLAGPRLATIQVGLSTFSNTEAANPGPLLAAAVLAMLPAVVVYVVAARRITAAFLHSGLR